MLAYWRFRRRAVLAALTQCSENFPDAVDVVYLWCDPADPDWVARRSRAAKSAGVKITGRPVLGSLDELRYSLRSLCRYFPAHRKVWLVTDNQIPEWLNLSHPKLALVNQNDLLDHQAVKPCYNSLAIESYFHEIENLSEHFIYFNDDFFLCRPTQIKDWFDGNGRIRTELGRWLNPRGKTQAADNSGDANGQRNASRLLDAAFKKEPRLTVKHRPYTARKLLFRQAQRLFPEAFSATRRSQFRSERMYTFLSGLIPYMAHYTHGGSLNIPSLWVKDMHYWTNDLHLNKRTWQKIRRLPDKAFCVQQDRTLTLSRQAIQQFHAMMGSLYPSKSPYET